MATLSPWAFPTLPRVLPDAMIPLSICESPHITGMIDS